MSSIDSRNISSKYTNRKFSNMTLPTTLLSLIILCLSMSFPANADKEYSAGLGAEGIEQYSGMVLSASVVVNKSQIVNFEQPFDSLLIAQTEIADIVPLTDHSVYILGKALGSTRLVATDKEKNVLGIVEIEVTHDLEELGRKLSEVLETSDIILSSANGGIVLSGTVHDATEVERAIAIAQRYAPEAVTNALSVLAPQQVMLEVRFVEASRTAARELGVSSRVRNQRTNSDTGAQAFVSNVGPLITSAVISGAEPFGTLITRILAGGTNVDLMIRALEERSLARRLAEPNLTALSGDTANFLAGGEFPFPVSVDNGKIGIEFKKYGVALAFSPTVLADGQINLKIEPEVSDIDPTTTVAINDVRIPGLVVRRASTTVELRDGQSFAIAGLLQNGHVKRQAQLPWLGQVPILGTLFRSAEFQRRETDLVIIVTPRLVKPVVPGEKLATPLDNRTPTNDLEFFGTGAAEIEDKARHRGPEFIYGHIIHLPQEVAYVPTK